MSISDVMERLDAIEAILLRIEGRLSEVDSRCKNMDDHIDFVESVHDRVRRPLSFLLRRARVTDSTSLPEFRESPRQESRESITLRECSGC